ncbi:hypothetical protein [Paenibacillus sp.]|uniref:hypothetical protein n=1 Tax=Paenibacillus sp. TaxID=58172 RepID=UPI002D351878|nr:hypothetical protein [Paenibacillus sp.]HZG55390.1 hypothetical protein [Paenibacillus sp.]
MAKQERMPLIPPVTAVDELGTIKEALILGLLLTVFDRDIKVLQESKLKTKGPYVDLLQRAMDGATADLARLRRRLKEKGIKMTEERRDESGVGCVYWCRGYKASFEMLWHFAKAETEVRMRKYLGEDIRKYVRDDLPDHLKPQWLLAPVANRGGADGRSLGAPASSREQLGEGEHARPDERGRQREEKPIPVIEPEIEQSVRGE